MTNKKFTDEQIIKALEHNASKCKFYEDGRDGGLFESTLDFIKRLKAENERLKERISYLEESIDCSRKEYNSLLQKLQQAQSEAIKEFAERLKSKVNDLEFRTKTHRKTVSVKFCDDNANWVLHECVPSDIDNLVKEMTEVQE